MTDDELSQALATLANGGVVAAATETFFGLLSDPRQPRALDALFDLKGRAADKGVALLVAGKDDWRTLVDEIPPLAETLADRFWPGPLTIALAARSGLDPRLVVDGTVGARAPGASDAARIVAAFGAPLTATSANRAGAASCVTSDDVKAAFPEAVATTSFTVVPGTAPGGAPSTLVAVSRGQIRIVRSGRVQESDLLPFVPASSLR